MKIRIDCYFSFTNILRDASCCCYFWGAIVLRKKTPLYIPGVAMYLFIYQGSSHTPTIAPDDTMVLVAEVV